MDGADPLVEHLLARCTFPPAGTPVTCAVSGGADSLALLVLATAAGCEVTAAHVDHGLRDGSAAEAARVATVATRVGAAFWGVRVEVRPGGNLEARARAARYAALPADVLTGHTADDQAETMLLNLIRGAGLDGLAGIRPEGRPLLRLRRAETRALCDALDLEPFEDPSNASADHRRNRVRHELLPLLDEVGERDVAAVLARQAVHLRDAADHLAGEAAAIDPTDARAVGAAPPVLARIAVRRWVAEATDLGHPLDAAAVDRVLAVARLEARAADLLGGWRVARRAGRLRLVPPEVQAGDPTT
ncbi:tRNA lysidine(34) synthetase TilS [Actinomarinicola tropica]|uniref:tRNA(Ile)-lysidine synthase n=1 Tax=Actinomarinicola tropica TaxID=2789776 RepID=A0A5Q2RLZ9_9ACTN|nr:tRNA lysidine(34) synthetase TilS [Actinomarinicola tropica]QGG96504.1 tRNA lysidine(34) synthetase TilS [Actinomarinicola tropica]